MQYQHVDMMPMDFEDWYDLVRALALHAVSKYGVEAVRLWHFETWNEVRREDLSVYPSYYTLYTPFIHLRYHIYTDVHLLYMYIHHIHLTHL